MLTVARDGAAVELGRGVREGRADALAERERGVEVGAGQQDREFLAAEPAAQTLADAALQRRGEDLQRPVADRVAVGVVDLLEMVEVGEQHRERLVARRAPRDRGLGVVHEGAPVGTAR